MKLLRYISVFSFLVSVLIFSGCTVATKDTFSKEPAQLQPFTERLGNYVFPIPSNFSRKDDLSMIYENKGVVRAYLVYVGKASTPKLVAFFDKYMKKNGWKKELFIAGEDTVISYSRDNQLIVFKIHQSIGGTVLKVLLTTK
ncbi:hypothetical protein SAMN06265182_1316 [Persephonella hydrogeniphila]|uniref:Lipoprotein n=1 Tax=Persephonella hydrogeniphila TaxID=198703 RepID=A0A285NGB9_9AQUI|nr:hypothetical protein [Persephonella hydrogeniphila]SNZ08499.1 hypothetical protein SAMN06265182_1316 [Persephonella hydrogeniphila]